MSFTKYEVTFLVRYRRLWDARTKSEKGSFLELIKHSQTWILKADNLLLNGQ